MKTGKIYKHFIIIFAISLFLEIFIFNFRFFQTLGYEETSLHDAIFNDGLELQDYELNEVDDIVYDYIDEGSVFKILQSGDRTFEFMDINQPINNVYIDIKKICKDRDEEEIKYYEDTVNYTINVTDEANKLYFDLPSRTIALNVEKSNYVNLNLSGISEKIKFQINGDDGDMYVLSDVKINVHYPMLFSFVRFICVFSIMSLLYIIRPKSPAYKVILDWRSNTQKLVVAIVVLIHIISFITIGLLNPDFVSPPYTHHYQYQDLTNSIIDGHVYLDTEPGEELKKMDNPYDNGYRSQIMAETGERYLWDRAYYNGKYYVYFGIVPVLTMYLPFKLITGIDFPTCAGIIIVSVILIFAVLGLVNQIIRRWFNKVPFIVYLLLSFMFIDGCGIIYILKRPDFYSLPIIMAILFSVSGLYFWISSFKYNNTNKVSLLYSNDNYSFSKVRLFLGSLCMAAVSGCRPQLLLASFFAVFLFWNVVFKDRKLFSKQSIVDTILFCLPYIVFAVGIMWYNYIRFDSPFDYGANYNLTTNDMTRRGIVFGRTFLGIFMYLFEPPVYSPRFPFISDVWFYTNYMGKTIRETMYGGIVFSHMVLWSNFLVLKFKSRLKEKGIFGFCLLGIISAVAIVVADTQLAGILQRYMADFGWLLFLSATIIMLLIVEIINPALRKHVYSFIMAASICSFIYNFATIFFIGDSTINTTNPEVFYSVQHLIQFWL